jgi:hypothetical protein
MNEAKIGSLWEKTSKNGVPFMSGELIINGKTVKIVAFRNKQEWIDENNKRPQWEIRKSKDKQGLTI